MSKRHIAAFVVFLVPLALAQTESNVLEAAKLGLFEKTYESSAYRFRTALEAQGFSTDEIEKRLFEAVDAYAACAVLAAQAQAREQGLPEDIVLKGLGHKTRGKDEAEVLFALDLVALKRRTAPCAKALGEAMGVEVR